MNAKEKANLLIKLLQNEKFLARFNDVEEDLAATKALFASEGLDFSDDQLEVIIDSLRAARKSMYTGEPLSEEQMDNVSGGKGIVRTTIRRLLAGVILTATLYTGYKVLEGVQKKKGGKNSKVLGAVNKVKGGLDYIADQVASIL